ncbi:MAG: winged helix-turn-helix transcriptional regulator [Gemmatimonadetes bacterium]|nr:winged helix-turn-helix transcriptional regulator [Gemmatimonadota bacterium]MBI2614481.1 winged helix-turn-helix transcriptional regulator [Gemmatimonadota bacterium]
MPVVPSAVPVARGLDTLFRAFADRTRLRILNLLTAGELCVCDMVQLLGVPQPTVSRHLAYLRRAGLVAVTRDLRFAHYQLAEPQNAVHQSLIHCVRSCFTGLGALERERRAAQRRVLARRKTPC